MISFDVPWWVMMIIFIVWFVLYFGIGMVLGLLSVGVTISVLKRRGVTFETDERICVSLTGAIVGGCINLAVVYSSL